ncbi:hypothetical protein FHU10_2117 [Serratia fonticola]|jgi:hypothetical protein|uniref:Uncharacterized protein n=1 Tax=Serratia fonticola TaxID=47917 RepID=A0A559T4R1_SERFO|nr:hypothetical protein FHU09_0334 [Serratia fonticola]TQI95099.1 hypothetical protein FHU11_0458 [Serratia fonticola]TVZ69597.1 hypothetical protein FHU10_2117 [Serratia fonticola]
MPEISIFQNGLVKNFLFFNSEESFWQALVLNQPIEVVAISLGEL